MSNILSPFSKHSSIVLYLEPILNTYFQTYQNIITVSHMPPGPLSDLVIPYSASKLSPFKQSAPFMDSNNCVLILLRYPKNSPLATIKNTDYFMMADDIPSVFSYLITNGYTVDTSLTNMLQKSRITMGGVSDSRLSGDRKMICMVTYVGL
jgi:hypothetical protein